jgi:dihydropyrimidinase
MPSELAILSVSSSDGHLELFHRNAFVTPGGVDAHVHIAQGQNTSPDSASPSAQCADDFETGSRAAVAGGTTTMISFAVQTRDDKSLLAVVDAYNKRAEATGSYIDYGFHIICTRADRDILESEMPVLVKEWGVVRLLSSP